MKESVDRGSMTNQSTIVEVRKDCHDTHIGQFRLSDIFSFHWSAATGGPPSAPLTYLHGYVMCDKIIGGDRAHFCKCGPPHGGSPQQIKVCISQRDNEAIFFYLLKLAQTAGEQPR
jgi:hypothetical protein